MIYRTTYYQLCTQLATAADGADFGVDLTYLDGEEPQIVTFGEGCRGRADALDSSWIPRQTDLDLMADDGTAEVIG